VNGLSGFYNFDLKICKMCKRIEDVENAKKVVKKPDAIERESRAVSSKILLGTCSLCRARKDAKLFTKGSPGSTEKFCDVCAGKLVR
jgi:hypothetical protein